MIRFDDLAAPSIGAIAGAASSGSPSIGWASAMALLAYVANEVRRLSRRADRQDDRIDAMERALARRRQKRR